MHNLRNQLLGVVARAKALRVGLAMSCIAVLALPVVAVGGQAAQPPRPPRPPVRSLPAGVERPSLGRIRVPYPNSLVPQQVIANVQKIVTSIRLDEVSGIPELRQPLQAARILQVRSDLPPPGFLVVELQDRAGKPVANMAMTRGGEFMALENARDGGRGRSLSLGEAGARVRGHVNGRLNTAEYVYFVNTAEPGLSIFRPLVSVSTEEGTVYLNSRGEAFAEESSSLARALAVGGRTAIAPTPGGPPIRLLTLGSW